MQFGTWNRLTYAIAGNGGVWVASSVVTMAVAFDYTDAVCASFTQIVNMAFFLPPAGLSGIEQQRKSAVNDIFKCEINTAKHHPAPVAVAGESHSRAAQ